jgi:hypothetical protein
VTASRNGSIILCKVVDDPLCHPCLVWFSSKPDADRELTGTNQVRNNVRASDGSLAGTTEALEEDEAGVGLVCRRMSRRLRKCNKNVTGE